MIVYIRGGRRGINYTRLRELLLERTEQLGMDPSELFVGY